MDLATTFAAIPDAVPIAEIPDAWFWTHAPKFGTCAILSRDGHHAFQSYAHNSYDEGLARAVITFTREHDTELLTAPERPLAVAEGFEHPGYGFDTLVAVGPGVHRYQSDKPEVHRVTWSVFPAYRCEFSGAETQDEAAYRYTRAAGAQPTRWDREPNPYLRMRHRTASGREIPERGFINPSRIVHEFTALPDRENGFVEFENFQQRVWKATYENGYTLTEQGPENTAAQQLDLDGLVEFTKQVLYGPNRASGESAINKG